ncbi:MULTISPECIES: hypothetical protein [unclassified Curtobacterium]|uniref:hypothetical protein n=1 Tax=unclassified Curtobacterium TaxID=257496 RepID=UPI000F4B6CA7|nr:MULTISPECIES: hypothetical protein [unclassified Curtobacterium]ROP66090.1 hypothetical protein EDF55_0540 [Curtobacterium sp. ZW137]TCK60189.1 hypothetical protein EDF27_3291 [Curtobacterium sp. PhB136]
MKRAAARRRAPSTVLIAVATLVAVATPSLPSALSQATSAVTATSVAPRGGAAAPPHQNPITASTSADGRHFVQGGTWTADLGDAPRIGLISLGGSGFTSTFDDLRVSTVAR